VKPPVSGSMILAGVLLKLGGYGLFHIFPISSKYGFGFSVVWVVLRLVRSLFVNLFHTQQTDLKSMTTYSSAAYINTIYTINKYKNWWYHNTELLRGL